MNSGCWQQPTIEAPFSTSEEGESLHTGDHLVFNWRDSVEWLANLAVLSSGDDESDDE